MPNAFQNRIQFFEHWLNSKLCEGNTVALKIRNNRGEITELRLLDWNKVTPLVADDGSVFYQINPDNMVGIESSVTVPAREVIHDRFNCLFHPLLVFPRFMLLVWLQCRVTIFRKAQRTFPQWRETQRCYRGSGLDYGRERRKIQKLGHWLYRGKCG